ncbi:hypothetical protein LINGRAHAP2_LOCUS29490, partial [Linum grandiflorum]
MYDSKQRASSSFVQAESFFIFCPCRELLHLFSFVLRRPLFVPLVHIPIPNDFADVLADECFLLQRCCRSHSPHFLQQSSKYLKRSTNSFMDDPIPAPLTTTALDPALHDELPTQIPLTTLKLLPFLAQMIARRTNFLTIVVMLLLRQLVHRHMFIQKLSLQHYFCSVSKFS